MKKIFLSAAAMLLLVGCESYPNHELGTGDYGFTYDLNLPVVGGSQNEIAAAMTAPEPVYGIIGPAPGTVIQSSPAQNVTFYEGTAPQPVVVTTTPAPVVVGAAPVVTTPAPVINEPAGAAVGTAAVAPGVAAGVAAPGYAGGGFVVGDGGVIVPGTNAVTQGTGTNGIVINNTNSVVVSNNIALTNATASTNMSNTNSSLASTNLNTTNGFATTNFINTPTNTGVSPVAGATNNMNTLPRAAAPAAGTPPGTALVPNRPIGEPAGAQISPSPNVPAGAIAPTAPTQPGPTTPTQTGTQTTTPTQIPQVNIGGGMNPVVTPPQRAPQTTQPTITPQSIPRPTPAPTPPK